MPDATFPLPPSLPPSRSPLSSFWAFRGPSATGGDVATGHHDGAGGGERPQRRQLRHPQRRARLGHQRATSQNSPQ